jgi:C4-dicarboxylate transporter DctQ subunit
MKKFSEFIDRLEENFIAILLGLMTMITFGQVVARYGFNTGWGSALEITQVLFAWLILFGMSYGIKLGIHLGVDLLIRKFSKVSFKFFTLFGAFACIVYGVTLFSSEWITLVGGDSGKGGAWFYWSKMYTLNIGMESIALPEFIDGPDQRLPRWVAYLMLPIGLALFVFRSIQAFFAILLGKREMIIASHEAEDLVENNKNIIED